MPASSPGPPMSGKRPGRHLAHHPARDRCLHPEELGDGRSDAGRGPGVIGLSGEKPAGAAGVHPPRRRPGEVLSSGVVVQTNPLPPAVPLVVQVLALGQAQGSRRTAHPLLEGDEEPEAHRPRSGRTALGRRRPGGRRRPRRGARAVPRCRPQRSASGSIWSACRWRTLTRMPSWSTPSSVGPT